MAALSWKIGQSDLWTDPAAWSTGTVPGSADDVSIAIAPAVAGLPYTVTLNTSAAVHSINQSQAASILAINGGTLSVAGTDTLAGTLSLASGATLQGGTYVSGTGMVLIGSPATLSGLTWDGTLDLVSSQQSFYDEAVSLLNDSFAGIGGTGAGTLAVGQNVQATLQSNASLQTVHVALGQNTVLAQASGTLALGGQDIVTATGYATLGNPSGALSNQGQVDAVGLGANLTVAASTVGNSGTFAASNGGSLYLDAASGGSVGNTGLLSVGAGSYLRVQSAASGGLIGTGTASGTLAVAAGGTLSLDTALTTAQLAGLPAVAGTLAISGALDNTGATLRAGAGANLAHLELEGGTITGGTIVSTGGFSVGQPPPGAAQPIGLAQTSTLSLLSGVTVDGALAVNTADAQLAVNGLTLNGTGGAPASLAIGDGGTLTVQASQTLDNLSIGLGGTTQNFQADILFSAGTLTLGSHTTLTHTGNEAGLLQGATGGGEIVNQGTILAEASNGLLTLENVVNAGTVAVSGDTAQTQGVVNSGTIAVTSGELQVTGSLGSAGLISVSGTDSVFQSGQYYDAGLANTGTLSVSNGAYADLGMYGSGWTNSGTFAAQAAEIQLGGTFTVAELGTVQLGQGGTLGLYGTLLNTGTLAIGTGTALPSLALAHGTIQGGVVADAGGGLIAQGGILAGVTYRGVLSLAAANATLYIQHGLLATGSAGSGAGSISISGTNSSLVFDTETLNNVAISIGASGTPASLAESYLSTLTLGSQVAIQQTGAGADIGSAAGALINQGHIVAAQSSGTLTLAGTFDNTGTIAVSNGETLMLDANTLTNTGQISVTNGVVDVGSLNATELATLHLTNSPVAVTGTLVASGSTLSVGAGGAYSQVKIVGTVQGGTLHDGGGGVQFQGNAVLDGITYQGALAVTRPFTKLTVRDGLTLTNVAGTGPGSLALTGAGTTLDWDSTQALDRALLTIGSNGTSYAGHVIGAPTIVSSGGTILLGAHLRVQQAGTYADIGANDTIYGNQFVSSAATITANVSHGQLSLAGDGFSNTGTIGISNTETVTSGAVGFTNAGLMVVGVGSALDLDLYNYFASGTLADQSFTNTGTVTLAGGMVAELTDSGAFPNVPLLNAAAGHIVGAGVVESQIDNYGVVEAHGGTLNLVQTVSGIGALRVDGGAMLVLGGVGHGQTVSFSGTGGVLGLQPAAFLGTIGGFASGDTIDLFNTSAHSAAFSGNALVVTLSSGATLSLTTTSALTGSLSVTAGTHGDSLIRFASAGSAVAAPAAPAVSSLGWQAAPQVSVVQDLGWGRLEHPL